MRITRKSYEKALKQVEAAREQTRLVRIWDEAVKRLGDIGNQQLVAITVGEDGTVRTECELAPSKANGTPPQTKPQQPTPA